MMGGECLEVDTSDSLPELAGNLMVEINTLNQAITPLLEVDEAIDAFKGLRSDSMGKGFIYYFPGVAYER